MDIMGDGSSTGWTDEKHMLYINSLEESFVTQLNDGKVSSKGGHDICEGNRTDTIVAQGYLGMDEVGGAASRASQAEFCIGSASCYRHQEDSKSYFMGGDASTTEPRQERISYHAKQKSHGASSASSFHWHGQSPSWTTELPEQNLDTEVRREQSVACGNKRLKHAATTNSGLVVSPGNANLEGYYSGSSSDCDIGLLKADTASPSWKAQALRTWSV
ncbi:uncharacterized protein [Oryza sativa Japonica Group]|uniref:uncharacterized protein isoform X2 n=1 Tax=Oryza sativa subsp. japonica TaxID=39947 RepID=UPI000E1BE880|nr:uncharacterized protein LOC4333037 isoform X2 [Oryza sativa Japonica Group]